MKSIVATLIVVGLAGCAGVPIGIEEEADSSAALESSDLVPDGYVAPVDVCLAMQGGDVFSQSTQYKPHGGMIHLPTTLTADQIDSVRQAAQARFAATAGAAVWRVVSDADVGAGLPVDFDGIVLASCNAGNQGPISSWAWAYGAGGIGVVWSALGTKALAVNALKSALVKLEGVGVHGASAVASDPVDDAILYLNAAAYSVDRALYETGNPYGPDVGEAINAAQEAESQLSIAISYLAEARAGAPARAPEVSDQAGALLYLGAADHSIELALAEVDGAGGVDPGEAMNYAAEAFSQIGVAIDELEAIGARKR